MGDFKGRIEFTYDNNHGIDFDEAIVKTDNPNSAAESLVKSHKMEVQDALDVKVFIDGKLIDVTEVVEKTRQR